MSNGERLYRNINAGMLWGNRVRKERVIPKNELYRVQKLIENKSRLKSVVLSVIPTIKRIIGTNKDLPPVVKTQLQGLDDNFKAILKTYKRFGLWPVFDAETFEKAIGVGIPADYGKLSADLDIPEDNTLQQSDDGGDPESLQGINIPVLKSLILWAEKFPIIVGKARVYLEKNSDPNFVNELYRLVHDTVFGDMGILTQIQNINNLMEENVPEDIRENKEVVNEQQKGKRIKWLHGRGGDQIEQAIKSVIEKKKLEDSEDPESFYLNIKSVEDKTVTKEWTRIKSALKDFGFDINGSFDPLKFEKRYREHQSFIKLAVDKTEDSVISLFSEIEGMGRSYENAIKSFKDDPKKIAAVDEIYYLIMLESKNNLYDCLKDFHKAIGSGSYKNKTEEVKNNEEGEVSYTVSGIDKYSRSINPYAEKTRERADKNLAIGSEDAILEYHSLPVYFRKGGGGVRKTPEKMKEIDIELKNIFSDIAPILKLSEEYTTAPILDTALSKEGGPFNALIQTISNGLSGGAGANEIIPKVRGIAKDLMVHIKKSFDWAKNNPPKKTEEVEKGLVTPVEAMKEFGDSLVEMVSNPGSKIDDVVNTFTAVITKKGDKIKESISSSPDVGQEAKEALTRFSDSIEERVSKEGSSDTILKSLENAIKAAKEWFGAISVYFEQKLKGILSGSLKQDKTDTEESNPDKKEESPEKPEQESVEEESKLPDSYDSVFSQFKKNLTDTLTNVNDPQTALYNVVEAIKKFTIYALPINKNPSKYQDKADELSLFLNDYSVKIKEKIDSFNSSSPRVFSRITKELKDLIKASSFTFGKEISQKFNESLNAIINSINIRVEKPIEQSAKESIANIYRDVKNQTSGQIILPSVIAGAISANETLPAFYGKTELEKQKMRNDILTALASYRDVLTFNSDNGEAAKVLLDPNSSKLVGLLVALQGELSKPNYSYLTIKEAVAKSIEEFNKAKELYLQKDISSDQTENESKNLEESIEEIKSEVNSPTSDGTISEESKPVLDKIIDEAVKDNSSLTNSKTLISNFENSITKFNKDIQDADSSAQSAIVNKLFEDSSKFEESIEKLDLDWEDRSKVKSLLDKVYAQERIISNQIKNSQPVSDVVKAPINEVTEETKNLIKAINDKTRRNLEAQEILKALSGGTPVSQNEANKALDEVSDGTKVNQDDQSVPLQPVKEEKKVEGLIDRTSSNYVTDVVSSLKESLADENMPKELRGAVNLLSDLLSEYKSGLAVKLKGDDDPILDSIFDKRLLSEVASGVGFEDFYEYDRYKNYRNLITILNSVLDFISIIPEKFGKKLRTEDVQNRSSIEKVIESLNNRRPVVKKANDNSFRVYSVIQDFLNKQGR